MHSLNYPQSDRPFCLKGFVEPHAIAVSADGSAVLVGETAPTRVWKFERRFDSDESD